MDLSVCESEKASRRRQGIPIHKFGIFRKKGFTPAYGVVLGTNGADESHLKENDHPGSSDKNGFHTEEQNSDSGEDRMVRSEDSMPENLTLMNQDKGSLTKSPIHNASPSASSAHHLSAASTLPASSVSRDLLSPSTASISATDLSTTASTTTVSPREPYQPKKSMVASHAAAEAAREAAEAAEAATPTTVQAFNTDVESDEEEESPEKRKKSEGDNVKALDSATTTRIIPSFYSKLSIPISAEPPAHRQSTLEDLSTVALARDAAAKQAAHNLEHAPRIPPLPSPPIMIPAHHIKTSPPDTSDSHTENSSTNSRLTYAQKLHGPSVGMPYASPGSNRVPQPTGGGESEKDDGPGDLAMDFRKEELDRLRTPVAGMKRHAPPGREDDRDGDDEEETNGMSPIKEGSIPMLGLPRGSGPVAAGPGLPAFPGVPMPFGPSMMMGPHFRPTFVPNPSMLQHGPLPPGDLGRFMERRGSREDMFGSNAPPGSGLDRMGEMGLDGKQGGQPKSRQLMKDWLVEKLDMGDMADVLDWVNKPEGLFKIKWLHKATDSWFLGRDAQLFKEWCIHTGKYDERNENPRRWKANFRCALNSLPDVVPVPSMHVKKGRDAYRVFQILNEKIPEKVLWKAEQARKRRKLEKPQKYTYGNGEMGMDGRVMGGQLGDGADDDVSSDDESSLQMDVPPYNTGPNPGETSTPKHQRPHPEPPITSHHQIPLPPPPPLGQAIPIPFTGAGGKPPLIGMSAGQFTTASAGPTANFPMLFASGKVPVGPSGAAFVHQPPPGMMYGMPHPPGLIRLPTGMMRSPTGPVPTSMMPSMMPSPGDMVTSSQTFCQPPMVLTAASLIKSQVASHSQYYNLRAAVCAIDYSHQNIQPARTSKFIRLLRMYDSDRPSVEAAITIEHDFTSSLVCHNRDIGENHEIWAGMPKVFKSVNDITRLLERLGAFVTCIGNPEAEFQDMVSSDSELLVAYKEQDVGAQLGPLRYKSTVRSLRCPMLIRAVPPGVGLGGSSGGAHQCEACQSLRVNLQQLLELRTRSSGGGGPGGGGGGSDLWSMSKECLKSELERAQAEIVLLKNRFVDRANKGMSLEARCPDSSKITSSGERMPPF